MTAQSLSLYGSLLCAVFSLGCGRTAAPPPVEPSILNAEGAYYAMDLRSARRILERLVESKAAPPKDMTGALLRLALQDWQFYRDDLKAQERLRQADTFGIERSSIWVAMSRIAREAARYGDALFASRRALQLAETKSESKAARDAFCQAVLDEAAAAVAKGIQPARTRLEEARRTMSAALVEEPGEYRASQTLLGIALLLRDGPTALSAWRHNFQFRSGQAVNGMLEEPYQNLSAVLPSWKESPLNQQDRVRLVLGLAGSRFFRYAAWMARTEAIPDVPSVDDVLAYSDFLNHVQRVTEDYYRGIALGRNGESAYKQALEAGFTGLWRRLHFSGGRPAYSQARFMQEVRRRFGAELRLGANGNFGGFDLMMGHRVAVETRRVEQYARRVEVSLVWIGAMVENGYSGWFWDGRATPGGWSAYPEIAWIREAYLGEPYHNWRQLTDAQERSETAQEIARLGAEDDRLARANPHAYLPGMTRRMYFEQVRRLYDSLKTQGYGGTDLCLAFVSEFLRMKTEASIFAHEGRHAIDQAFFPWRSHLWSAAQLEFRAKLSEVAFAPDPKLALAGGSILGDRSVTARNAHSVANLHIKKMLLKWMEAHSSEIRGLDRSRPLLAQLDLMSNEQIVRACREADSMVP